MRTGLQLAVAAAVAVVAAAAGYWVSRQGSEPATIQAEATARLLALTLPDLRGDPRTIDGWRGRVLVINFWATWCPPCVEEMPGFERLSRKFADKGVQFVGIGIDSADKIREFASKHEITYSLLVGSGETLLLAKGFGNKLQGLPFTVIVDRDGLARRVKLGRYAEKELEAALLPLI